MGLLRGIMSPMIKRALCWGWLVLVLVLGAASWWLAPAHASAQDRSASYQRDPRYHPATERPTRVRFGVNLGMGGVFGASEGFGVSADIQLGVQFNDVHALYLRPKGIAALLLNDDTAGGYLASSVALMYDLTFWNMLQLGVGPAIDFGTYGLCRVEEDFTGEEELVDCRAREGARFAVIGRIALLLGSGNNRNRKAFALGLESHTVFLGHGDVLSSMFITAGFALY